MDTFSQITSFVTAKHIQKKLAVGAAVDQNAYEASQARIEMDEAQEGFEAISLVFDAGESVGWWWPYEENCTEGGKESVRHFMTPLTCSMIISGDAKYLDIADLFAMHPRPFYFVLEGTKITGTVSFHDLFSPLGRLCLFSLVLHLEKEAEDLCRHEAEKCFLLLSEGRQAKAHDVLSKRFAGGSKQNVPDRAKCQQLLACTTFIDKATMLGKAQLIKTKSRKQIEAIFSSAEKVRNFCAHTGSEFDLPKLLPTEGSKEGRGNLSEFVHRTQELIELIQKENSKYLP